MQTVLVANRGAIARRVVRACHELGLASVVVFSEADADAPYIAEATSAYPLAGSRAQDTYLNQDALLAIAKAADADAVHPGYGFLAENAGFARAVGQADMTFIGPDPVWLERMGDKVAARELMATEGFPVFIGSGLIDDPAQAHAQAEQIGYPLVVKPSGGGGGMGMQVVHGHDALDNALAQAKAISQATFATSGVYLERWLEQPRHIEFQILADGRGQAMHVFERECSVQRRHQKLIEESPAPNLDADFLAQTADAAAAVCARLGYDNVGTLETLVAADQQLGFLEMNTRIQVEHGVTEMVAGIDLLHSQIRLAQGGELPQAVSRDGFAIEARLYAEDAINCQPSTGRLAVFRPHRMQDVRVDTGYQEGQTVSPYYDPMLAKVIAWAPTRALAIGRLTVALKAFEVVGVQTNARLLMATLQSEAFLAGQVHTGILEHIRKGL